MSAANAPSRERFLRRAELPVAAALALIVAAVLGGLIVGGAFGGKDAPTARPAAPQPIAHQGLRAQVPSGWSRADLPAVPGFRRPLALSHRADGLRAAVERLPATSSSLLPGALATTLKATTERPDAVRLASGQLAWRYRFTQSDGSALVLYAAPTTSGVATIACLGARQARVPRGCDALAAGVTVPRSLPLEPGTSAAFFSRLPATVAKLEAARATGARELSAATRAKGQAAAADRLARAHRAAQTALGPLAKGDPLATATVGALKATGTAYAVLAQAARARSPRPFAKARLAVTRADAGLRRSMARVSEAANTATRAATATGGSGAKSPERLDVAAPSSGARKSSEPGRAGWATFGVGMLLGAVALYGGLALLRRRDDPAPEQSMPPAAGVSTRVTTPDPPALAPALAPARARSSKPSPSRPAPAKAPRGSSPAPVAASGVGAPAPSRRHLRLEDSEPRQRPDRPRSVPRPAPAQRSRPAPAGRGRPTAPAPRTHAQRGPDPAPTRSGNGRSESSLGTACVIEWRPEYVKSRFRAVLVGVTGRRAFVAESDLLDWPPSRPPEPEGSVLDAHTSLVECLVDLGWEPDEPGDTWYGQSFRLRNQRAA